jgi:hypothetical protein
MAEMSPVWRNLNLDNSVLLDLLLLAYACAREKGAEPAAEPSPFTETSCFASPPRDGFALCDPSCFASYRPPQFES